MATGKVEDGRCLAQCRVCGQWREVQAQPLDADSFFARWQGEFSCCGTRQSATFTLEKDEIDFH
ncbi:MAG: hypothetical protein A2Y80_07490 [Deltaproteobacteria bacterium RBG_13_58_19]|nr:MAG: hypothetical protein A2Y80_07490 [Deltaproteobacteria bacterium RBG_13_58_19]